MQQSENSVIELLSYVISQESFSALCLLPHSQKEVPNIHTCKLSDCSQIFLFLLFDKNLKKVKWQQNIAPIQIDQVDFSLSKIPSSGKYLARFQRPKVKSLQEKENECRRKQEYSIRYTLHIQAFLLLVPSSEQRQLLGILIRRKRRRVVDEMSIDARRKAL